MVLSLATFANVGKPPIVDHHASRYVVGMWLAIVLLLIGGGHASVAVATGKALSPSLHYVGIGNVLAGPDLSGDRRSLIHEGLAVWEADWRGGEPRPGEIVFSDIRYKGD